MNDFINSLRDKRIEGFKQRYRTYDVLLVDDVQFFEGRSESRRSSSTRSTPLRGRPPDRDLVRPAAEGDRDAGGAAALTLRVGLITDIQPPDLETRIAILRKKEEDRPDPRARSGGAHLRRRAGDDEHP